MAKNTAVMLVAGVSEVGTVYVQGSDCGTNDEGCVIGVTSMISGAPSGDFFYHKATCYGRQPSGLYSLER